MDPTAVTGPLQTMFDTLGLTELTGLMITITAMSGSFYFLIGIIRPPIQKLWGMLKQLTYHEVSVYVADPEFHKFNLWLDANSQHTRLQRAFKVVNSGHNHYDGPEAEEDDISNTKSKLVAGYGSVLVKAPGLPYVWVTRSKDESKQVYQQTETLTFRIFGFGQSSVHKFFSQVIGLKEDKGPFIFKSDGNWWRPLGRPKNVLPPLGQPAYEFIEDVEQFLANEDEYVSRGIPYKRGYLLHGNPGTGKTSIIAYLSKKLNMNVYLLSSEGIAKFENLTSDVKKNSIILIEDIDMTIAGEGARDGVVIDDDSLGGAIDSLNDFLSDRPPKQKNDKPAMNMLVKDHMREFLNALDGICQFDGSIIVATTNKPDVLDAALLRPGRIDKQIKISPFSHIEQIEHVNRFFGVDLNPEEYKGMKIRTFAEIQDICVTNINDVDNALLQITP